eukprot:364536-Chlamydomonas_euryale.AAC.13
MSCLATPRPLRAAPSAGGSDWRAGVDNEGGHAVPRPLQGAAPAGEPCAREADAAAACCFRTRHACTHAAVIAEWGRSLPLLPLPVQGSFPSNTNPSPSPSQAKKRAAFLQKALGKSVELNEFEQVVQCVLPSGGMLAAAV